MKNQSKYVKKVFSNKSHFLFIIIFLKLKPKSFVVAKPVLVNRQAVFENWLIIPDAPVNACAAISACI